MRKLLERNVAVRTKRFDVRSGVALLLFAAGFVIPFAASGWKGAAFADLPWLVVLTFVLWIAGLVLQWLVYRSRDESGTKGGYQLLQFIGKGSATILVLGIAFGFVYHPTVSTTFFGTNFNAVLAITLAVMGVQISLDAWKQLLRDIRPVLLVVAMRWVLMPLIAYAISFLAFHPFLPEEIASQLAIGMILLGTSPTGAASNSLTLISKGDLALSVSATTVSVLIAPFLQPLLVRWFVGGSTSVDAGGMFLDLLVYVLAPVLVASAVGMLIPRVVLKCMPYFQPIAVVSLALVLMGTVSKGTSTILENLGVILVVLVAAIVHGLLGLSIGYFLPAAFRLPHRQRVAASYEVGIENAAIAPALAISYFGPLALLPAVVYGKTQNLLAVTIFAPLYARKQERLEALEERESAPSR